jgi:cyclic pyranopterin phosphate synthase
MTTPGVYPFEDIDETLLLVPLAARRVLDTLGRKLSLKGWLSLSVEQRRRIVQAGLKAQVDDEALALIEVASPPAERMPPEPEPDETAAPPSLAEALGPSRPLEVAQWRSLRALDRYTLCKSVAKADKLGRAYDAIVRPSLAHLNSAGEAHMVDVGGKGETARRAVATACVRTTRAVVEAIAAGAVGKGDVVAVARVAGILAAKRTPELVPLCHPVRTTSATLDIELDAPRGEVRVRATMLAFDRTGVEMEAMVAASVAALTVYDMIKGADRWATVEALRLEAKSGGKSGDVTRPAGRA